MAKRLTRPLLFVVQFGCLRHRALTGLMFRLGIPLVANAVAFRRLHQGCRYSDALPMDASCQVLSFSISVKGMVRDSCG